GAVLALFNLDDIRRQEAEAQSAREFAEAILAIVPEAVVVLDGAQNVKQANAGFCKLLRLDGSDIDGKPLWELAGGIWNTPAIRSLLNGDRGTVTSGQEILLPLPASGAKRARLATRRIRSQDGDSSLTIVAIQTDNFASTRGD